MEGSGVAGSGGGRKRKKQILKYGHWHEQKFYPQHFHTMLWEIKKKINEGEKKSQQAFRTSLDCSAKAGLGKQRGYLNESRCGRAEVTTQHM